MRAVVGADAEADPPLQFPIRHQPVAARDVGLEVCDHPVDAADLGQHRRHAALIGAGAAGKAQKQQAEQGRAAGQSGAGIGSGADGSGAHGSLLLRTRRS
jgi:hypothetical protein